MNDNKARKIVAIDSFLRNEAYTPLSGLMVNLKKALLKLPAVELENLQLIIEIKETDAADSARRERWPMM